MNFKEGEEGRGKKEEGRGKREEGKLSPTPHSPTFLLSHSPTRQSNLLEDLSV
ncbi:MAG: hypothetical protein QQW96_18550 [Tychonema bourrellyi B0820]|nr:hypothetical protein [Tychonema bourrellyi B0820]